MPSKGVILLVAVAAAIGFLPGAASATPMADYGVQAYAGNGSTEESSTWQVGASTPYSPVNATLDSGNYANASFGSLGAISTSQLSSDALSASNYAGSSFVDHFTIYDPSLALGQTFTAYLKFNLDGSLSVVEGGTQPADTEIASSASVFANVKCRDLSYNAQGTNEFSESTKHGSVFHESGNWDLGGTQVAGQPMYVYDTTLFAPVTVENGSVFDMTADLYVTSSASITTKGRSVLDGLGDYTLVATSNFINTLTFNGFTNNDGISLTSLGLIVTSDGPTVGQDPVRPEVPTVPAPAGVMLVLVGLTGLAGARRIRKIAA